MVNNRKFNCRLEAGTGTLPKKTGFGSGTLISINLKTGTSTFILQFFLHKFKTKTDNGFFYFLRPET